MPDTTENKNTSIVFVDDDPKAGELIQRFCEDAEYAVSVFQHPVDALNYIKKQGTDLVVSDLRMPEMDGIELLREVKKLDETTPFIIITGFANIDNAIEALRLGATDFIKKPFDMDELRILIDRTLSVTELVEENKRLKQQLQQTRLEGIIGNAPVLQSVNNIINKIADVRCNVIIEGESGTGKELAARAVHNQSSLRDKPFIVIDCGALTDTLLESELFGHEKGAFTGATTAKKGLLETATGGTVFLDEIGNISDAMQAKLLRVVQEQQVTHVGGVTPIDIDVRFIVASNQNLSDLVAMGRFRHDLYHRLNVVKITMPPLRDRKEDIPQLVNHFITEFSSKYQRKVESIDNKSMNKLMHYSWPGNVRELRNTIERHVALADGHVLHITDLAEEDRIDSIDEDLPNLAELEQRYILKVLNYTGGSREETANILGINKSTLWRKLQLYKDDNKA